MTVTIERGLVGTLLLAMLVLFGVGGSVTAYVVMALMVLVPVLLAMRKADWSVSRNAASWLFLAAFLILLASFTVTAQAPGDVLYIANFLGLILITPLIVLLARHGNGKALDIVAGGALVGVALAFGMALFEKLVLNIDRPGYGDNIPITFNNSAMALGMTAMIGLAGTWRWRWLYLLGPALSIAIIVLTSTRGALLALPVVALVGIWGLARTRRLALVLTGLLVLALLAGGLVLLQGGGRLATLSTIVSQMLSGQPISDSSAGKRMALYLAGLGAYLDRPLLGYGWARMNTVYADFLPQGYPYMRRAKHLHNDLLDFGVAAGIPGLIAYATIMAAPIVGAWRSVRDAFYRARVVGCLLLVANYTILGLTNLMFGFEIHTTLYLGLAGILLGYLRERPAPGS